MKKVGLSLLALLAAFAVTACSGDDGGGVEAETKSPDANKQPVQPPTEKNLPGANTVEGMGDPGMAKPAEKPPGY